MYKYRIMIMMDADADMGGGTGADTTGLGGADIAGTEQAAPEPAPVPESTPPEGAQTSQEAAALRIKYNGEELELPTERARELAQMGMNYDKILRERDALRDDPVYVAVRKAQEEGVDVQAIISRATAFDLEGEVGKLRAQGFDEPQAREIAEGRQAKAQFERIKQQQQTEQERQRKMQADVTEFRAEFPGVDFRDAKQVPEAVWEQVRAGKTLTDAYSRWAYKQAQAAAKAADTNARNKERAAPPPKTDGPSGGAYFSQEQVAKMSPGEVRKNYDMIVKSMPLWKK